MPNIKTGQNVNCPQCGKEYYRSKSDIEKYHKRKTCGSPECKSKQMSGKNNPFYGKTHSPETIEKIKQNRKKNPSKGTGPKKGVFKHTEEAKKRIAAASRKNWAENREKRLESLPRGWNNASYKQPTERRHRINFTPLQRREWKDYKCAYCDYEHDLVLDHIIPVFDGGTNIKENCQTLCRGCNLWKLHNVDLPRYKAAQATKGAEINPEYLV